MPKVTNPIYSNFLNKTKITKFIYPPEFDDLLNKIKHKHLEEARSLCILLFYSGMRISEAIDLQMVEDNISWKKQRKKIKIKIPNEENKEEEIITYYYDLQITWTAKKNGNPIILWFSLDKRNKHILELNKYLEHIFPGQFLFPHFRKNIIVKNKIKKGIKEYKRNADINYWFKKWFGFPVHMLRHNRFSVMISQGATIEIAKQAKGAKTLKSLEPYMHLSAKDIENKKKYYHYDSDDTIL